MIDKIGKIEAIGLMFIGLDHLLTEKPVELVTRTCTRQLPAFLDMWRNYNSFEYYLSDGGYSRIWIDCWEGKIFLTDNSRTEVKEKWPMPQVQKLVADLRAIIEPEPGHYGKETL